MQVLVVEDSGSARKMIRHMLEEASYHVTEAADATSALESFQKQSFDLITLDLTLPDMDGFELCRRFREIEAGKSLRNLTPIIFITGNESVEQRLRGFEVGGSDFLTKASLTEQLLVRVQRILHKDRRFAGKTVMVVDDSSSARKFIQLCLQDCGVDTLLYSCPVQALQALGQNDCDLKIDLLITDIHMPGMNGDVLTKKVRHALNYQDLPVIMITAIHKPERVLELFQAGATDYLVKPFIKEELIARVLVHLENDLVKRNLREERTKLENALQENQKFLAACSHDLRSPLMGIAALCELNLEDNLPKDLEEVFLAIESSVTHLLAISEDIVQLAIQNLDHGRLKFEKIDLVQLLRELLTLYETIAVRKHIKLTLEAPEPCYIQADHAALVRICNNLISNALKFTEKNGTVTINLQSVKTKVQLSVKDSGVGISADHLRDIFRPLHSASRQGTSGEASIGLGLSIVKQLVENLFGRIHVESAPGVGSCFIVEFPRTEELAA